jgi:hypothetical protein
VHYNYTQKQHSKHSSSNDYGLESIVVMAIVLVVLYVKYHSAIITCFISISIMVLIGSAIIFISLKVKDQLDQLSAYWLVVSVILSLVNIVSIILLDKQNLSLNNGLNDYGRILYYAVGAIFIVGANLLTLLAYIYILSINIYFRFPTKYTYIFMSKLNEIYKNYKYMTCIVVVVAMISMGFSSGVFYQWILDMTQKSIQNQNDYLNSIN